MRITKQIKMWFAVALSVLFLTACTAEGEDAQNSFQKITSQEAKAMMEEGNVVIVDVRTKEEYEEGHILNAVNIPNETIGDQAPQELSDREAVILVYCRSGRRSADAAGKLSGLGYEKIYDFGGILDWPYETEGGK